jgi:hypothetical protein
LTRLAGSRSELGKTVRIVSTNLGQESISFQNLSITSIRAGSGVSKVVSAQTELGSSTQTVQSGPSEDSSALNQTASAAQNQKQHTGTGSGSTLV